ncbi:hypothetical protein HYW42_00500 [Candidatus Daviesbacteria bacterium]|nr:hypothetical protein [Candidatus Daviesbacteria bacterium]
MGIEEGSRVSEIRELLAQSQNLLLVVGGELGNISVSEVDPATSQLRWTLGVQLTRENYSPTGKVGVDISNSTSPYSRKGHFILISVFPQDNERGYYTVQGIRGTLKKEHIEQVFDLLRRGIKLLRAYRTCPPEARELFVIKDPFEDGSRSQVEDMLRQEADYLRFHSNKEPDPRQVVERIASRKVARQIGLSTMEEDPFPSEHILIMRELLSRKLEQR